MAIVNAWLVLQGIDCWWIGASTCKNLADKELVCARGCMQDEAGVARLVHAVLG